MNKDALLASIIGFIIGLIITGAVLFGPKLAESITTIQLPHLPSLSSLLPKSKSTPATTPKTDSSKDSNASKLTIDASIPDSIQSKDTVMISGSAPKNTTVVISGPKEDIVTKATDTNAYAGSISLEEGANAILVTSIAGESTQTQTATVYFINEKL